MSPSGLLRRLYLGLVRIRTRLLLINLLIVMVPVVGLEWARTFEREQLKALEEDMRHQAQVLRTILEKNLDEQRRPIFPILTTALEPLALRTRSRVRILDRRGRLLLDSHRKGAPEGPEPAIPHLLGPNEAPQRRHRPDQPSTDPGPVLDRPEVRAALRGELGTATRIHTRIQRVYLFLAMPIMVERRVEGAVYLTRSTVPVLQSLYRLRRHLYQVLLGALAFTALTTLFLAGTISRPLGRLTRAAQRITAGDRSHSLQLRRKDEIGELARAFDRLVQKLDARARYISEFAANISHEFKTPIASIRGAAELLLDGALDDPVARRKFLENIQADTRRLDRLVSRILELSRIEATLELRESFDLGDLVLEVADRFPQHPVEVDVGDGPLPCVGNRPHLAAALMALVENAVHFSPDSIPVVVRAVAGNGQLRLSVTDRGCGISEANQKKVFDRFFTTEAERGGTGLGLAIVTVVVDAHGGTLELQSTPGQGSCFTLVLPSGPKRPGLG